jgi:hypothetical protein
MQPRDPSVSRPGCYAKLNGGWKKRLSRDFTAIETGGECLAKAITLAYNRSMTVAATIDFDAPAPACQD